MNSRRKIWLTILCLIMLLTSCRQHAHTWQEQYDLGVRYLSEGNYEEAIIAFTAAIEIDPKQAPAYVGRGDAYIGSGDTEENLLLALDDYEIALSFDADDIDIWNRSIDVYIALGEHDSAMSMIEQAIAKFGDVDSLLERKDMLVSVGNDDIGGEDSGDTPSMDRLSDRMHFVTDELNGGIYNSASVNSDKHILLLGYWFDKGADVAVGMIDQYGTLITTGYLDAIWFTENGYAKVIYCYADAETEAAPEDVYDIAVGNVDGCAWAEEFDWNGVLIGREKLGDDWRYWASDGASLFPPVSYPSGNAIGITWETTESGIIFKDGTGLELGYVEMENPDELNIEVMDHFILIGRYFECIRVYWVD